MSSEKNIRINIDVSQVFQEIRKLTMDITLSIPNSSGEWVLTIPVKTNKSNMSMN